jgi:GNAT superfamily N-acetyltransferase
VTCRPAVLADAPLLRRLLPDAVAAGDGIQCFVAQRDGATVGVAALACRPSRQPDGFPFALSVIEPFRRQGVGRALVGAVADEARRWGMTILWPYFDVEDGIAAAFLRAVGAVPVKQAFHFEGDASTLHGVVRPIARRLRARLRENAAIVPLAEAPAEQVAALHRQYLGGSTAVLVARARGEGETAFSPAHSVALVVDGRVGGAVLYAFEGDIARVDAVIVAPPYRRSGATALLMDGALERGLADGPHRIRFWCWEDTHDTMKFARRAGSVVLTTLIRFRLDVGGHGGRA